MVGVSRVVSLMETTEVDGLGRPFVDSRPELRQQARLAGREVQFERIPIRDMGVP